MLVVIVLAGILVSVVTISVTPDPRQKLTREAERVGQLMALAADEARIRQLPIVWEADLRGSNFSESGFWDAVTTRAELRNANLKSTLLE